MRAFRSSSLFPCAQFNGSNKVSVVGFRFFSNEHHNYDIPDTLVVKDILLKNKISYLR